MVFLRGEDALLGRTRMHWRRAARPSGWWLLHNGSASRGSARVGRLGDVPERERPPRLPPLPLQAGLGMSAPMAIAGKLEAIVKFGALPTDVSTDKSGHKTFAIQCETHAVRMTLRPKLWKKLEDAARDWPQWVAAVAGQLGPVEGSVFVLLEPNLQVFEKKAKVVAPVAAGTSTEPKPGDPVEKG